MLIMNWQLEQHSYTAWTAQIVATFDKERQCWLYINGVLQNGAYQVSDDITAPIDPSPSNLGNTAMVYRMVIGSRCWTDVCPTQDA